MYLSNNSYSRFLIIWVGQLISSIGSGLTAFALGIYVFQLTGSATKYSLVLLAAFLPSLILKPIGGTFSDRMNRRLLMIIGDLGSAVGVCFIVIMLVIGVSKLWVIYLGTIISSIFVALQNPAYKASITDLVPHNLYAKASALLQLAESSRYLVSPIIAGFLLKILQIKEVLIIDMITFFIAIIAVFWVKEKNISLKVKLDKNFYKDFIDGFKYLFQKKAILLLICIISMITFFVGILQSLWGPIILSFTTSQAFGTSLTISTTGMLIGSVFIGVFWKSYKNITVLSSALTLSGIFLSLIGIRPNIILITLFGFLFFLVLPFVNTSLDVLVRSNVEDFMQGRIWSLVSLISQLGMAIALSISGYIADHIFSPLLLPHGKLSSSIGTVIGIGPGRGMGLMLVFSGLFVIMIALIIGQLNALKNLEY